MLSEVVVCEVCGMTYLHEDSADGRADKRLHRRFHNESLNGIPAKPIKSDNVIVQSGYDRIVLVTAYSSMAQRVRARKVARLANREMRYDFGIYGEHERPDERDVHVFLHYRQQRGIGLALLEKRTHVNRMTWQEYDQIKSFNLPEPANVWTVGFIWMIRKYRHQSQARKLLMHAVSYVDISIDELGIYPPLSEKGEIFARSIFTEKVIFAG